MTREEMFTKIIRKYGYEHPHTIAFFKLSETHSDIELEKILEFYLK